MEDFSFLFFFTLLFMVEISSSASFHAIKWWLPSTPTCHRRTRVGDDTSDPPTHHPQTDTTSPSPFLVHLKKKKMKGENQDIFRTSIFLSPPPTSGFSLFATYLSLLPPPSHFSLFLLVALFFFFSLSDLSLRPYATAFSGREGTPPQWVASSPA